MKRSISIILSLAFAASSTNAQISGFKVDNFAIDSFEIGTGSSFVASKKATPESSATSDKEARKILADLTEAIKIITSQHVSGERIDINSLTKNSITGALQSLDPHSNYFDNGEYREFLEEQQSEYSGIGATIGGYWHGGHLDTYIVSVVTGSPAANAGLAFGDRIVKVNGEDVSGKSTDEVRDAVRGAVGTKVKLLVERNQAARFDTMELRRRLLQQRSIRDSFVLPGDIGYIAMTEGFNFSTSSELNAALQNLHRHQIKGLIIDLRENPGGILDQAVKIAEQFLPSGSVIVTQRGRSSVDNRVWISRNRNPETLPLVLLVNENSASASEILAGALQDHDRALIIGEKTFGKGLVQSLFDGPAGTGLTLTTARYYTPSGRSIQRDYSDGNLYDYYSHHTAEEPATRSASKTSANRTVYSGDGIDPDDIIASHEMTPAERKLDDLIFFFVRDMAAGRSGKPAFIRAASGANALRGNIPAITEELTKEFAKYANAYSKQDFPLDQLASSNAFITERLAYVWTMAVKGDSLANRINVENDLPVLRAISQLPKARELALANIQHRHQ